MLLSLAITVPNFPKSTMQVLQAVSYHGRAMPLFKVLKELSPLTGDYLQTVESLKNDVVVVDVSNVTTDELLAHIANVEYGTWAKSGNVYTLLPSETKLNQLHERNLKEFTSDCLKEQKYTYTEDSDGIPKQILAPVHPPTSFEDYGMKIVNEIGFEPFFDLKPGKRIVYSTKPGSMQHPFPERASDDINAIYQVLKPDKAVKIDFVVGKENDSTNELTSTFIAFDNSGNIVDKATGTWLSGNLSNITPVKTPAKPIEFSADSKLMIATAIQAESPDSKVFVVSPRAHELYFHPTSFDPLMPMGEVISQIAKSENRNLVAAIPDNFYFSNYNRVQEISEAAADLYGNSSMSVVDSGIWLDIAPNNPETSRENNLDRAALERYLQYASQKTSLSIEDLANLALVSRGTWCPIIWGYFAVTSPSLSWNFYSHNAKLEQFFGSLSELEKQSLYQGRPISFEGLNPAAKQIAFELAFDLGFVLKFDSGTHGIVNKPVTEIINLGGADGDSGNSDNNELKSTYLSEPTEVAPNGLIDSFQVQGKFDSSASYAPVFKDNILLMSKMLSGQTMNENQLVTSFLHFDGVGKSTIPTPISFRVGVRNTLSVRIYLAPGVYVGGDLFEDSYPENAPVITESEFPKSVKDKLVMIKELEDRMNKKIRSQRPPAQP